MNFEIYINQVLKKLGLPFFKRYGEERGDMIWIDDGAWYHTSKRTMKWCQKFGLLRMLWPAQSLDLNPIKNLWCIIKIRVSAQRHWIHLLEVMQKVIHEEWDKLMKKDFCKCIESMPKRCKLVILARSSFIKY